MSIIASLRNISRRWDSRIVLDNVSLDIYDGECLVVTGPNGGGKTTLLRLLLRLLSPTTGSVTLYDRDGRPTDRVPTGYLPQKSSVDARFPVTVGEVVEMALTNNEMRNDKVNEALRLVGLEEHRNQHIGTLSGGQLQRALLARAIVSDPRLLVLDEPLSYLDEEWTTRVVDIIAEQARRCTVVLVTHEPHLFADIATRSLSIG